MCKGVMNIKHGHRPLIYGYRKASNMWQKRQTCHISKVSDHVLYTYTVRDGDGFMN